MNETCWKLASLWLRFKKVTTTTTDSMAMIACIESLTKNFDKTNEIHSFYYYWIMSDLHNPM